MSGANRLVDSDRLWADIMDLAAITEPDRPWTRRAFSPLFLTGRELVKARMEAAGLMVRLDAAGNLIGRREGAMPDARTLVIGSHSDTVPDGGRFDGIAGLAVGIEAARIMQERGITLSHAFEVYDCLAEEVSPYGISCVGSRAVAGLLTDTLLERRNDDGETLRDGVVRMGGQIDRLTEARRDDIAAYLELHIEQGPVLETSGTDVGLVTAISGITRVLIEVSGRPDHAGTTPMGARADALCGGADMVLAVEALAGRMTKSASGHLVATVGEARVFPNAANVIPQLCTLLVDIRAEKRPDLEAFLAALAAEAGRVNAARPQLSITIKPVSDNPPAPCSEAVLAALAATADEIGTSHRRMASGAGHDVAWFSRVCPAAMIFVPCKDGRSHCPEEWSDKDQVARGADLLIETLLRLDREPPSA